MKAEVTISYLTVKETTGFDDEKIAQLEQEIDGIIQDEINLDGGEFEIDATTGPYDSIEVYDDDGNQVDPTEYVDGIQEAIAGAMYAVKEELS